MNAIDVQGNVFGYAQRRVVAVAQRRVTWHSRISSRLQSFLPRPVIRNCWPGQRSRITLAHTCAERRQPFAALDAGRRQSGSGVDAGVFQRHRPGMNPQKPSKLRFDSSHFVSSFDDHKFNPGLLSLEQRFGETIINDLKARGHKVDARRDFSPTVAPTIILFDPRTKLIQAGADPRRGRYAMGW
ncbi:MAG: hypothetical protein U0Y68_02020 [Blastocatellia bacterium]